MATWRGIPARSMLRIALRRRSRSSRPYAELATYLYPKRKAVELATDPIAPAQSKLVVEFVRAAPQVVPPETPVRDV
jgi:hypothetical protein